MRTTPRRLRAVTPTDAGDPTGGTTEIGGDRTKTVDLADGRTAVVEAARVDGFTLVYYYFDASGMEDATDEELGEFLQASGVDWSATGEGVRAAIGSMKEEDAQGREIWEVQITYWG